MVDGREHPALVERARFIEVSVFPAHDLQLAARLTFGCVDPRIIQLLLVHLEVGGIDDVKRFFTLVQPFLEIRAQDAVLLILAVEERADMKVLQLGSCNGERAGDGGIISVISAFHEIRLARNVRQGCKTIPTDSLRTDWTAQSRTPTRRGS